MTLQPPFALFVVAQDVDVDYINGSLTRAWKGNFEFGWDLWVATDSYDDVPKRREDNRLPERSKAPIPETFRSSFAGKTLRDCAKWLQKAPSEIAVQKQYFTAIDQHSKEDDTVMVCRVVDPDRAGDLELEYFPQPTNAILMEMATNDGLKFDEKAQNYQRSRMNDGQPDRSRVGPYQ